MAVWLAERTVRRMDDVPDRAGWHLDPGSWGQLRYFDGVAWTDDVRPFTERSPRRADRPVRLFLLAVVLIAVAGGCILAGTWVAVNMVDPYEDPADPSVPAATGQSHS